MARTKAFNRDKALLRAMYLFWEQGYEATSTDDLLCVMGIGRQSMYDTFGDKHRLYLEALQHYANEFSLVPAKVPDVMASPLTVIETILLSVSEQTPGERARGCMAVNAISELATRDSDVALLMQGNESHSKTTLAKLIHEAKIKGEIDAALDEGSAGHFLLSTLSGLRVSAKAGATPKALREIAVLAMRALRAQ